MASCALPWQDHRIVYTSIPSNTRTGRLWGMGCGGITSSPTEQDADGARCMYEAILYVMLSNSHKQRHT